MKGRVRQESKGERGSRQVRRGVGRRYWKRRQRREDWSRKEKSGRESGWE